MVLSLCGCASHDDPWRHLPADWLDMHLGIADAETFVPHVPDPDAEPEAPTVAAAYEQATPAERAVLQRKIGKHLDKVRGKVRRLLARQHWKQAYASYAQGQLMVAVSVHAFEPLGARFSLGGFFAGLFVPVPGAAFVGAVRRRGGRLEGTYHLRFVCGKDDGVVRYAHSGQLRQAKAMSSGALAKWLSAELEDAIQQAYDAPPCASTP